MSWLSFKRQENGKYLFKEGDLSIEYDESGLLKVYKKISHFINMLKEGTWL